MWHNIFVVIHEVSSGGPAVVLLVLELFKAINTKGCLCQHMRRISSYPRLLCEVSFAPASAPERRGRGLEGEAFRLSVC